jgi:hypothetical protein
VINRRTTLKWVAAAAASAPLWDRAAAAAGVPVAADVATAGYGTDPALMRSYTPGDPWPLTMTPAQRRAAAALSDLIIPADAGSPGASAVGVVDFLDEWISAPYPRQRADRAVLVAGLEWIDAESATRFQAPFAGLSEQQQCSICDDICSVARARPPLLEAASFFARFRDLAAGGFYTTAIGRTDLQYQGNVPLATFDGPPAAVKQRVGVA